MKIISQHKSFYAAVFAVALALTGCSGFEQDPTNGMQRDAIEPGEPQEGGKTDDPAAVRIDALDSLSFVEGRLGEYKISGRVLLADYRYEIEIDGLQADFPGATYDKATQMLKWTPPRGTVGTGVVAEKELKAKIFAYPTAGNSGTIRTGEKLIRVFITTSASAPSILAVDSGDQMAYEERIKTLTVTFTDEAANPAAPSTFSRALVTNAVDRDRNLAPFVVVDQIVSLGNNRYRADLQVNLMGVEMTTDYRTGEFQLQFMNNRGFLSAAQLVSLTVVTDLRAPEVLWPSARFRAGVANTHTFMAFNPKFEGDIRVVTTTVPAGMTLRCFDKVTGKITCSLTWTPAAGAVGTVPVEVEVTSEVRKNAVVLTKSTKFSAIITVE